MTDIRGIHYEISKPVRNDTDGYYYQRVRQVDGQGNLVGTGDQRIRLPNRGSKDRQYEPGLDWVKIGKDPEEPLSINAAYLLYLKRLSASQAQ